MKKLLLLFVAALLLASNAFASVGKLYGIGSIDGWGGWNPAAGQELTKVSDGVFEWSGQISGVAYFAFASELGSWDVINKHRFSPAKKDTQMVVGENAMVANVDTSWKIMPGKYTMHIDTNKMIVTLSEQGSVELEYAYVIHGQFTGLTENDWADFDMIEEDDDLWTITITPSVVGGEFGVMQTANGSQCDWYSAGVTFTTSDSSFILNGEPGGNCDFGFSEAGIEYAFAFVPSTKTLTITRKGNGVEDVEAADSDAPVTYYNLQGIRVETPQPGHLYIRTQSNQATKQIAR